MENRLEESYWETIRYQYWPLAYFVQYHAVTAVVRSTYEVGLIYLPSYRTAAYGDALNPAIVV